MQYGYGRGFGRRVGAGFGFRGVTPPWPYFGRSRGAEMAQTANAPLLGQLPIDTELAKLCDEGNIERYDSEIVSKVGKSLSQETTAREKAG